MTDIVLPIIRHHKNKQHTTNLTPFDGWLMPEPDLDDDDDDDDDVVYRDSRGFRMGGIFSESIKKCDTIQMSIIHMGWIHISYHYPNIELPFKSPLVRWNNLFYCGGFSVHGSNGENCSSNDMLIKDMISGLKPIGFVCLI